MVRPFISGTVQRFSYTRWLTSWRTFQSLPGVGSSHWSPSTARTLAPNSSTALRCSSAWSGIGSLLSRWALPGTLLVAKGHDRLHAGPLAGRPDTEEPPHGHADPEGQGDRPAGDGRRHGREPPDQQGGRDAEQDPGDTARDTPRDALERG